MKIATIVTAVALATGGAAFAADHSTYDQPDTSRHAATARHDDSASYDKDSKASGHGFVERTRNALHRMGQKLRGATHREHSQTAMDSNRSDTRSMGAAGESRDSARQHRMDNAYSDSQSKRDSDKH